MTPLKNYHGTKQLQFPTGNSCSTIQKNYKLTLNPVHIPFNHKRMDKVPRFSRLWPRSALSLRLFLAFFSPPFARKASIFSSYLALAASNFSSRYMGRAVLHNGFAGEFWRIWGTFHSAIEPRMLPFRAHPKLPCSRRFPMALDTENLETQILTDLKILVFLQLPKINVTFGRFWVQSGLSMPFGPYTMEIQLFKMRVQAGCHVCRLRFHMTTIYLYGYGSIPINTIFGGMKIHKSQLNFEVNYRGTRFWHTAIYLCSSGLFLLCYPDSYPKCMKKNH